MLVISYTKAFAKQIFNIKIYIDRISLNKHNSFFFHKKLVIVIKLKGKTFETVILGLKFGATPKAKRDNIKYCQGIVIYLRAEILILYCLVIYYYVSNYC